MLTRGAPLTLDEFLGRFTNPRRAGDGWLVPCPAHEDRHESLSVSLGRQDAILLKCHAGCTVPAILAAMGLTMADLFPPKAPKAPAAVIEAVYPYLDRFGALLYEVVRYSPKGFKQRRPDGAGGYLWNLKDVPRVLYRLPKLQAAKTVVIVEGERDCESVVAHLGYEATTAAGGAGSKKWLRAYTDQVAELGTKAAILLPDNDDPGRAYMQEIARELLRIGLRVKLIELPGLGPKQDVTDWIQQGGTKAAFKSLVHQAAPYRPSAVSETAPTPAQAPAGATNGLKIARPPAYSYDALLETEEEPVDWLVDNLIPARSLILISAKAKTGKSTFCRALAAALVTGQDFLGFPVRHGPVLYIATEGQQRDAKAAFRRLGLPPGVPLTYCRMTPATGAIGIEWLTEIVQEMDPRPVLVVIDVMQKFLRLASTNDYSEASLGMSTLETAKDALETAIATVHHSTKRTRETEDEDVGDAIGGSMAIRGGADTTIILERYRTVRTLTTEHRIPAEPLEERVLDMHPKTGALRLGPSKAVHDVSVFRTRLLEALAEAGEPLSQNSWLRTVTGTQQRKYTAFRQLVAEKLVERVRAGHRVSYRIAQAPPPPADTPSQYPADLPLVDDPDYVPE